MGRAPAPLLVAAVMAGLLNACTTAPPRSAEAARSTPAPKAEPKPASRPETKPEPQGSAPGHRVGEPRLPPPEAARSPEHLKRQFAQRLLAANPTGTYTDKAPPVLLAVPVLHIELKADGHIHSIRVLREPRQARDTTTLAIEAVRRAAPFGAVHALPAPWVITESFLFNDDRRFKPRSLE